MECAGSRRWQSQRHGGLCSQPWTPWHKEGGTPCPGWKMPCSSAWSSEDGPYSPDVSLGISIGCGGRYSQPPRLSQGNSTTQGTASFWLNALWATITSFCTVLVQRRESVFQASGNPPFMFVLTAERSRGTGDGACGCGTQVV